MSTTLTITLPPKMKTELDRIAKRENLKKSDIVRSALGRYMARQEFWAIREALVPEAQKKGIYSDEDVFKLMS
jgi:predicted transcriptional regulator